MPHIGRSELRAERLKSVIRSSLRTRTWIVSVHASSTALEAREACIGQIRLRMATIFGGKAIRLDGDCCLALGEALLSFEGGIAQALGGADLMACFSFRARVAAKSAPDTDGANRLLCAQPRS